MSNMSNFSLFTLTLLLLTFQLTLAQNNKTPNALQSVVFTRWKNPPKGWTKFDTEALTATPTTLRWVRTERVNPRNFNFQLIAFTFNYIHVAPSAGTFVIRIGSIERSTCSKRRGNQFVVNGVTSPLVNFAQVCGCGVQYFEDIEFEVAEDLIIDITMDKLKGFWAPTISNFEIFAKGDEPTPFSCTTNGVSASPTASTSGVRQIVSPAVSPAASPAASPAMSNAPSSAPSSVPSEVPSSPPSPAASPSATGLTFEDISIATGSTTSTLPAGSTQLNPAPPSTVPFDLTQSQGLPSTSFNTLLQGADFTFTFNLPPGTYNVILGFIELQEEFCQPGARIFHVLINSKMRLESFDIFSSANGCRKAIVERFLKQTVDSLDPQPFTITFQGIAELAAISHIRIVPSIDQCVPVTMNAAITADHLAHAVPGEYPANGDSSFVDRNSLGYVTVNIDGSGSHTHFAYGNQNGRVISYTWTNPDTGKVISTKEKFSRRFNLGTTRLTLAIQDDACTIDESETSVTVTGRMQAGAYCYYYNGLTELPLGDTLRDSPRPTFAAVSGSVNLGGFPDFAFKSSAFVARCLFFIDFADVTTETEVSVDVGQSGIARVYRGSDLLLDTDTSNVALTSTSTGLQQFEMLYHRLDTTKAPRLSFKINGTVPSGATYDQATVLPIVTAISPDSGRVQGGGTTKISGYGLFQPLTISFGNQNVTALANGANARQFFVNPPASPAGVVQVTVSTKFGLTSNPVQYTYGSTCDPVAFTDEAVTNSDGSDPDLGLPTSLAIWSDGRMYIGSRLGVVRSLAYDVNTLTVTDICMSEVMRDERYISDKDGSPSRRSILGITFDPRDTVAKPYVALSTLFWQREGMIERTNPLAWSNGAIARLKPATAATRAANPKQCLEFDATIVRNLPVADGDHAVNEMVFNQDGDLLIAVGGNTNVGLPNYKLGGNWESYFSASVVIARLSRPSFNGTIDYTTPENLRTAEPRSDDVGIYATGFRNMFAMAMARNGKVYGADMGPNCGFGNASSSCDEYNEVEAAARSTSNAVPFPGTAITGPEGICKFGDKRKDKLLNIKEGKFYGHSNIQRALITNRPGECAYIDPRTDKTGKPIEAAAPSYYEPQMAILQSPMTAIREYGANLFCGRLRGNLITSRFKGRGTWRIRLKNNGEAVNGGLERFKTLGGLRVDENEQGDLLFPLLGKGGIYLMRPIISSRSGVSITNALPFRHGRQGGTTLRVGGWGFADGAVVTVDGKACTIQSRSATLILCKVPTGMGLVDVTVNVGGVISVLPGAILYMNV